MSNAFGIEFLNENETKNNNFVYKVGKVITIKQII